MEDNTHNVINILGIKIKTNKKNKGILNEFLIKADKLRGKVKYNNQFNEPVDLVYTWCSSSDEQWNKKRNKYLNSQNESFDEQSISDGRFRDNDELKYSLRSVEKYAPWINKIYIITDNQVPSWLNTKHPKIKIIDHKDIIPEEYLPTFNSNVLEMYMHKIPGLSEHFLYSNDDTFIGRKVKKEFFFTSEGRPYARMKKMPSAWFIWGNQYMHFLMNMQYAVFKKYNKKIFLQPHHNMDAYTKSICNICEEEYRDIYMQTSCHKFRLETDFQRSLIYYLAKVNDTIKLKIANKKQSFHASAGQKDILKSLQKIKPYLFCINDTENSSSSDGVSTQNILNKIFSIKSSFEL